MERKRLKERLANDMVEALKGKNKLRLSVLRLLRAAIKNEEIKRRKELTDPEVIQVLKRALKQKKRQSKGLKGGVERTLFKRRLPKLIF